MKRTLPLWLLLSAACVGIGQGTFHVVPSGLANVEGNSSSTALFGTSPLHVVQVYSASEFSFSPGASGLVSSVAFRFDGPAAQSFSGVWPSLSILLSTTTRTPDSLSPVFNNNIGADSVQVFSGSLFINANNTGASPRPFEVQVPFSTPFFYNPAMGNLSMSVITTTGAGSFGLDGHDLFGDGVGRVFGANGPTSGTVDTFGFVTRFGITEVPEPSTTALLLTAVAAFGISRCFKKSRAPKR